MNTKVTPFRAAVTEVNGTAVIALAGEINGEADTGISAAYDEASSHNPSAIRLNFADVDYINSTGIALIVGLLAKARASHLPLSAVGLSEHYREIFTITRLSDFIDIE